MFHSRRAKPAIRISASARRCGRRTRGTLVSDRRMSVSNQAGGRKTRRRYSGFRMAGPTATERDAQHLLRAIELAGRARGETSPNPMVGAVVVKDGRIIGEGITQPPGESHAEVMALEAAAGHT